MESNRGESSYRTPVSAWTVQQSAHHTIHLSKHGRGSRYNNIAPIHSIGKLVDEGLQAVEKRQLRKVELAHRGGLDGSRNDRPADKTKFIALRDYIAKYMASDDFEDVDQ